MGALSAKSIQKPRIALIGNLANVAYQTCKFLRRKGVAADVFVSDRDLSAVHSNPRNHDPDVFVNKPNWLIIYKTAKLGKGIWSRPPYLKLYNLPHRIFYKYRLFFRLRRYDLIESFCCTPFWIRQVRRPYISFATGSDLRELTLENSIRGRRARKIFQNAQIVFFEPDPSHMERVRALKLKSSYPYRQIIDTDFYSPTKANRQRSNEHELLIFHPTNQDWSYHGTRRNLAGLKGNDKLIRALARLVKEGHKAKMILLDRGPDREKTKRLISELEIWSHIELRPEMNRHQLKYYYNYADIVADQFIIGVFGLIGLEAMACGRPVLVYVHPETAQLCYEDFPPVLNCRTEDEIYTQLKLALNPDYREKIGRQAREWIMKYHHWEKVIDKLIWHYETVLGRKVV